MSPRASRQTAAADVGRARDRRLLLTTRLVFVFYAVILSTVTHWPALRAGPAPFEFFDKVVHFGAFGLWTLLLIGAGFFGRRLSRGNIAWCVAVGLMFSGLDEATQSIPGVNRHSSWSDYFANAAGALSAGLAAAVLVRVHKSW